MDYQNRSVLDSVPFCKEMTFSYTLKLCINNHKIQLEKSITLAIFVCNNFSSTILI